MNILGLNFYHANAAAALFQDGRLVAAAEEERFNRVKFSAGLPLEAIAYCLREAGLQFRDVDLITYARSTNARVVRDDQIHYQDRIYRISSLYDRYRMNLKLINFKETLARRFGIPVETLVFKIREADHHLSHLLSGFHYSSFDHALLLSCDAFGDFVSMRTGIGRGSEIELLGESPFPHSVGLFYTMVTQFLGFKGYGDESKVMGLSTFGYPEHTDRLRDIISIRDRVPRLNLEYFDPGRGVGTSWGDETPDIGQLFNHNLTRLIGPARTPGEDLTGRHQNLAASLQHVTEEIVFSLIEDLCAKHATRNLVFTGGLAFNSLLNERILQETEIESIYIPPAPGNAGLAIGSALAAIGDAPRVAMRSAFWGPGYSDGEIEAALKSSGVAYGRSKDAVGEAVRILAGGATVGWFQGRMEFGPRSLGDRSILINPAAPAPQRLKNRDYLKPFGISILREAAADYFHNSHDSPFMSFMGTIRGKRRREFESAVLNNRCRYQTVGEENPLFLRLLSRFREKTGLPFLINTSLNPEGEPIVDSPAHFLEVLDSLPLDAAFLGDFRVEVERASGS